jgi:hypothetical protein
VQVKRTPAWRLVCTSCVLACAVLTSRAAIVGDGPGQATSNECGAAWMRKGIFGISTHYFPLEVNSREQVAHDFDVDALARGAANAGAAWVMLTLQHQNWIMMAPNEAFAKIVGSRDFMTRRDVPGELARSLKRRNLPLMLYVNLRLDPDSHASAAVREAMGGWPPSDRLIANIASVYREFSLRYGRNVAGWWVDGAGVPGLGESPNRERWFAMIKAALTAGNPDAIVAFNPGLRLMRYSRQDDYTAGEGDDLAHVPRQQCVEGALWHAFTYLGGWWGADGMRFSDNELCRFIAAISSRGGAATFDVGTLGDVRAGLNALPIAVRKEGIPDTEQIQQLRRLRKRVNGSAEAGGRPDVDCR